MIGNSDSRGVFDCVPVPLPKVSFRKDLNFAYQKQTRHLRMAGVCVADSAVLSVGAKEHAEEREPSQHALEQAPCQLAVDLAQPAAHARARQPRHDARQFELHVVCASLCDCAC